MAENSLSGALYPSGLGLYANHPLRRQVTSQREANPRPDVTDLFGYGPTWGTYVENLLRNAQQHFPPPGDTSAASIEKLMGLLGITAFHGSPHRFSKFDMSKVGTGEGAQAYGHGLYFAENPKVAQGYRDKLSDSASGNLYKVDIPDDAVGKMLDWDRPLSQQPAQVQEALRSVQWRDPKLMEKYWDKPASDFYRYLAQRPDSGGAEGAAETLRTFGIPGIRYLDQGSRASGSGTYNFVVFDDQLPKIVGRQ